jgi:hypothetical protein
MRVIFARTEMTTPAGVVTHYYDFVFAVGQLVFKLWRPTTKNAQASYKTPTSFATRIWPLREDVVCWPPGRILDDDGVTELWDTTRARSRSQKSDGDLVVARRDDRVEDRRSVGGRLVRVHPLRRGHGGIGTAFIWDSRCLFKKRKPPIYGGFESG